MQCRDIGLFDNEEAGEAALADFATDALGEDGGHAELLYLGAGAAVGDAVGEDHLGEGAVLYALVGGAAHDAVGGDGAHATGTLGHDEVGSLGDGAGGIDDVIEEHDVHIPDVTDDVHAGDFVGTEARFVAHHHGAVEELGIGGGALGAADVGGGDTEVLEVEALDVGGHYAAGEEVVNGHLEETLLLVGVEVHSHDAVDAGDGEHVGHEFGGDAYAGL